MVSVSTGETFTDNKSTLIYSQKINQALGLLIYTLGGKRDLLAAGNRPPIAKKAGSAGPAGRTNPPFSLREENSKFRSKEK